MKSSTAAHVVGGRYSTIVRVNVKFIILLFHDDVSVGVENEEGDEIHCLRYETPCHNACGALPIVAFKVKGAEILSFAEM